MSQPGSIPSPLPEPPAPAPATPPVSTRTSARTLVLRGAVLAGVAAAAVVGWKEFWFLTDDAFITFRYISNSVLGYGWTWNPPPFARVEGYSNFLWMLLLEAVWRVTGIDPPHAANGWSLGLSLATLAITFGILWRLRLPPALARFRFSLAALALVGIVSNRTFLAWTSSGLETALFAFTVVGWVAATLETGRSRRPGWLALSATAAALSGLTRPDGALFAAATGVLAVALVPRLRWRVVPAAAPLLLLPVHLVWRRLYYGAWVPNTYVAKHLGAWPEAGVRYAASFVLEYAWWWLLGVALVAAVVALVALLRRTSPTPAAEGLAGLPCEGRGYEVLARLAVVGALVAHAGYYTLIIGGDHFEYRVYAHLVPLLWVALVALVAVVARRPAVAFALVGLQLALSLPIPWTHYAATRNLESRAETHVLIKPVAPLFPSVLRPLVRPFDELQAWLIERHVGMRHQEHKVFRWAQSGFYPRREDGEAVSGEGIPVLDLGTVGVPGWVLPHVAIIDTFGLNDRVVARGPRRNGDGERKMAHDRAPPKGYVACFRPNVSIRDRQVVIRPRTLTPEQVRRCEERFDPDRPAEGH
jgi:arabinofuranosyltransferase